MNNKIKYIIFIILLVLINTNYCSAKIFKVKVKTNEISLRTGPGTSYNILKTSNIGDEYTLITEKLTVSEYGCENGWYNVYYDGPKTAYICSNEVDVYTIEVSNIPQNECETNLQALGFPSSYWSGLCKIKESHPNWIFTPIITNLDWSESVNKESSCGNSYIENPVETNIDKTCKNPYTKTWYPASSTAVAYYMDPRNFLDEKSIFQFEYLKYDNNLDNSYESAVASILANAEFYKYHLEINNNLANVITTVGKDESINVSPIFIASRIYQELGSTNKLFNLYSGTYSESEGIYLGFYNFYNFGVTDACATTSGTTVCGLQYAINNNWNSLSSAIAGGASQIASSYIAKGQYTRYLQRFNVSPTESNKLYIHQYMTNVAAPLSEGKTAYNSYNKLGIITDPNFVFSFYIPVYLNMDDNYYIDSSGAIDTPDEKQETALDISTIITSSGYKYSGNFISGIEPNTKVETLKANIEAVAGYGNVLIKNSNDVLITDGLIGTGNNITIKNDKTEMTLTIIIKGDTSGDGIVNALDLAMVQKNILKTFTLSEEYFMAGDTSSDGEINAIDLAMVQKNILGTFNIEQ